MKYAAKRHVQSVRQVVRQIKRDSHPDGFVGKQLMNMKSRGADCVKLRAIILHSRGNVYVNIFKLYRAGQRESRKDCLTLRASNFKFVATATSIFYDSSRFTVFSD